MNSDLPVVRPTIGERQFEIDGEALRRECGNNEFKIDVENRVVVSSFDTEVGN